MRWNGKRATSCEKAAFKAIFCYLLCLALVAGYSCFHLSYPSVDSSAFTPGSDLFKDWGSYAVLTTSLIHGWSATNEEGKNLHCAHSKFTNLPAEVRNSYGLYGDMKYHIRVDDSTRLYIPFSHSLAVQIIPQLRVVSPKTNNRKKMTTTERLAWEEQQRKQERLQLYPSPCSAMFYDKMGESTANTAVSDFSGVAIFHSDNVIELYGDTRDIKVKLETREASWTVSGSGGLYAKIAVVGGEIKVEGLTSYEVEQEKDNVM